MSFRPGAILLLMLVFLHGPAGCAPAGDRTDFHRHSMSDLREDWRRPGILLFEASSSSLFPADSESAEEIRMEWLAAWMKRTGHCPAGWELISRSDIDPGEVHARRHDLRYELRCVDPGRGPAH
jgi:hypothetical protein